MMQRWILVAIIVAGCSGSANSVISQVGQLENKNLDEASGLARSQRDSNVLWSMNDDGKPVLYAFDLQGKHLGKVSIDGASNKDWEDLTSFTLDGTPYLLVADIGDNDAKRKTRRLYVIEEPQPEDNSVAIAWQIRFSYAGGPRDVEAAAVDTDNETVLLLSKREIPAVLYSLPLRSNTDEVLVAQRLGAVTSLPQPGMSDVQMAAKTDDWYWQPTGMDIAADNRSAIVLTYGGVYYYRRDIEQSWFDAFKQPPMGVRFNKLNNAEAICFNDSGSAAYVTVEKKRAPLYRIDLTGVQTQ
jgi:hypothetical protein